MFMNSENSKKSYPRRQLLNLADKMNLKRSDKHVVLLKKSYKNNKLKISAPKRNEKFELPDGSYSLSDIQDYQ